jgi:decaprenylphospho-beta-D-ribofuranose 2-oxidase
MSAIDSAARESPVRPYGSVERMLSGWGRTAPSRCETVRVAEPAQVPELLAAAAASGRGVIARGAGRSYGDAAQLAGGLVLDMRACDAVTSIDAAAGLARVQAGVTLGVLLARLAERGLTLPVLPGTRHVTVAGAIASDIHGKTHHRDGAFARHVRAISLATPAGEVVELTAQGEPDLFYATLGGMGLTGVVLEATLAAEPLPSLWVAVDTERSDGLGHTLELLAGPERHRYSVAWLDLLAGGARTGRAVITRADALSEPHHANGRGARARGSRTPGPAAFAGGPLLTVPRGWPAGTLRPALVRAFNAARWRSAPRCEHGRPEPLHKFLWPLDVLGDWSRLYGASGMVQYQLVVPDGHEAVLERCVELLRERRAPAYLAVLKRFGPQYGGPLSFPLEGFTLALDVPAAAPGLRAALDELDRIVAECGGRVYLSKDARLGADALRAMYPRLDEFGAVRARVDPAGVMRSDLALRLGLCAGGQ